MQTPLDKLNKLLADEINEVNLLIRNKIISDNAPRIPEVTAHLIDAGGKRVRPLLTLAATKLFEQPAPKAPELATAVEFIHTATLLHDDVVDGSEKRRGKKTANLLWDNKSSILVGDYLFSRAFQLMVETGNLEVLDILANASAIIAEGEVLQLMLQQDISTTETQYFNVIEGKTAALFAASTEAGAVIAHADKTQQKALHEYGLYLGLAFQIADDVLDFIGDEGFGKMIGNDFIESKLTLPIIHAISKANDDEYNFWQRTISKAQQQDDDLKTCLSLLEKHGSLSYSIDTALNYSEKAKNALKSFATSPIKDELIELSDYVVRRLV